MVFALLVLWSLLSGFMVLTLLVLWMVVVAVQQPACRLAGMTFVL